MGASPTSKPFRRLWVATGFGITGEAVTEIAFPLVAVLSFHATSFETSALMASEQASWLVLGLFAGVVVDRFDKSWLLGWSTGLRAVLYASIPAAAILHLLTLQQLFVVSALAGVAFVVSSVASDAITPELVERSGLTRATSRLASTRTSASLAGRGIAGVLVQVLGAPLTIGVDALATGAAAVLYGRLRVRGRRSSSWAGWNRVLSDIREGLAATFSDSGMRALVLSAAISNFLTAAQSALGILFLVRTLHAPVASTGVLLAASSVGGLAGSLACHRLVTRWGSGPIWRMALLVAPAIGLLVPAAQPDFGLILFVAGTAGSSVGSAIVNILSYTTRQAVCPPELRGRVAASTRFTTWGVIPLGLLAGGAAAIPLGLRGAVAVVAVANFLPAVVCVFSPLWRGRDLEQEAASRAMIAPQ